MVIRVKRSAKTVPPPRINRIIIVSKSAKRQFTIKYPGICVKKKKTKPSDVQTTFHRGRPSPQFLGADKQNNEQSPHLK